MNRLFIIIERLLEVIERAHTRILVYLYRRYDRKQSSRKRNGCTIINEFYCKEIERRTVITPKQEKTNVLITKYISLRFPQRMRCIIYNNKGHELGRMPLETPEDISRKDDFLEKILRISVPNRNAENSGSVKDIKAPEQRIPVQEKKTQEAPLAPMPLKELKFTDAGKHEYLKEKEETGVVINRIASMNASKTDIADTVEKYVLGQFTEENGFCADVAFIHSGLREQFNIIWADSIIDKINAKYWDTLKNSLINLSEGKYHIKKEQLYTISHE